MDPTVNLVPLSFDRHAGLRVRPITGYQFAGNSALVSLYGTELFRAAHEFPIAFSPEADGYFPAALLGTRPEQNVFVDAQGRWLSSYVPALWRRGAFRLARIEDRDEMALCVDGDSPLLSRSEGEPLFDAEGRPSPFITRVGQFLAGLEADRTATLAACAALDRCGVLKPWDLQVRKPDGSMQKIGGLFIVDETRLAALSGDDLAALLACRALPIAYAQLFSLHKLPLLGQLAALRDGEAQKKKELADGTLDLDKIFGIVEDDPFVF